MSSTVTVTINGVQYTADSTSDPTITADTSLAEFIRTKTPHRATKISCAHGGCGACTVGLTHSDAATGKVTTRPINSCLAKLFSLNGMSITTNEGIGNAKEGYNAIQKKMAELSATQCGYCSNGFVMTLWSYLQQKPDATELELESILDGNLCRCTGYRPILDAYKSFATAGGEEQEVSECRKENCCQRRKKGEVSANEDIEEIAKLIKEDRAGLKVKAEVAAKAQLGPHATAQQFHSSKLKGATGTATTWQDVDTLQKLGYWMQHYQGMKVMLTVGATTLGIYEDTFDAYLNIAQIPELNVQTTNQSGITIGSSVVIADVIDFLSGVSGPNATATKHIPQAVAHLKRVAGFGIRSRASIGGNLMLCHEHQKPDDFFPSDPAIVLMGLEATVSVLDVTSNTTTSYSMADFFSLNMSMKVLVSITIPYCTDSTEMFQSYKIALRQVMSHSYVNAAMKMSVDPSTHIVTGKPVIAFGGIAVVPTRMVALETQLVGMDVTDQGAFSGLASKLQTTLSGMVQPGPTVWGRMAYRVQTAVNYFYKFFIFVQPGLLPTLNKASKEWMTRPVTQASQTFEQPTSDETPVSIAMPKADALAQTAGEATYTADIPSPVNGLFGTLVQADRACCNLTTIDTTAASAVPGFVKFYSAANVPKESNVFNVGVLYAEGQTNYAGQAIGMVVATSQEVADRCAKMIAAGVTYSAPVTSPIISIDDCKKANSLFPATTTYTPPPVSRGDAATALKNCKTVVTDTCDIGSQFHIHMENHAVLVSPVEGQFVVDSASQSVATVQQSIANCLKVPQSDITVRTRRCGGGFGAKVTAANFAGCCAAWAARDLNVPVRLNMHFKDPQRGLGSRPIYQMTYSAGVDENNKLQAIQIVIDMACGYNANDVGFEAAKVISNIDNCYNCPNFSATVNLYQSNIPPVTSVRGPGWIQSILYSEMIMNKLAQAVSVDPISFRALNFYQNGDSAPNGQPITQATVSNMWTKLQTNADVATRQAAIKEFNSQNKFVKRGLSLSAARFSVDWAGMNYNSTVAIYPDGSITVTHGGIEIGQGINTKVMQAVAYKLGLNEAEMNKYIKVLTCTTRVAQFPTNVTGGSITSELCCRSVMNACDTLNARLAPFKTTGWTWQSAIRDACGGGVDLLASGFTNGPMSAPYSKYDSWGVTASEVEVDTLTGQFEIIRSDLIFDCGISMNPDIDVGQVEGGFMFGVGWFTQEVCQWDKVTGQALTAGTWEYKPPFASDTPETFNVTLLENSVNKVGVLSSKAVGEPPVAMATSVVQAIEAAVNASRTENGNSEHYLATSVPLTIDKIAEACGVSVSNYTLN